MAAKGGVWTKKGFVKAADRKDNSGVVAAVENNDPATRLNSSVATNPNEKLQIANEARKLYEEAGNMLENADPETQELIKANRNIMFGVSNMLESNKDDPNIIGVIVKDKNGKTQAVAVAELIDELKSIQIEDVATHPRNMDRNSPDAVRGAGTQAMARFAKLAQEQGRALELISVDSAQPFYEKLGFKQGKLDPSYYSLQDKDSIAKLAEKAR